MFNGIKNFFTRFYRKEWPAVVETQKIPESMVVAETPVGVPAPALHPAIILTHAQKRRESRLKRLQAIKNPPAWVLSEIEELKRVD